MTEDPLVREGLAWLARVAAVARAQAAGSSPFWKRSRTVT